ncbi:MAG TPA: hypothetical protein PLA52_00065 [Candidatus Omnitrophota bacterium]|nr:hypothetical protein [Candidatus Omnitrophota bacterium]
MNNSARLISIIIVSVLAISVFSPAFGDIIKLKDGTVINGRIIKEDNIQYEVKLKTGGTAVFPRSWIISLKKEDIPDDQLYTVTDKYAEKLNKMDTKSASAHLELAEWCQENGTFDNGLLQAAKDHLAKAAEIEPKITGRASDKLLKSQEKHLDGAFKIAEVEYKHEEYIKAEHALLAIINSGIESSYVYKSKELLRKIWGSSKADQIMASRDDLPDVEYTRYDVDSVISHIPEKETKDAYLKKCLIKAKDYEERAQEVNRGNSAGYYIAAITCYHALSEVENKDIRELSNSKSLQLMRKFFDSNPVPFSDARRALMTNYLVALSDPKFSEEIAKRYLKVGDEYYKKARKLKQPEKGEKAQVAYYSYSIVNDISKDEKVKQSAFENMVECQRLERARK